MTYIKQQETEVHLWLSSFVYETEMISFQQSCLTIQEQQYATSFYFEWDRIKFIQGRFWVKSILAQYLDKDVRDIYFKYNPYGKPELRDNPSSLSFNLSHSQDLIVLAIGQKLKVGLDIEFLKDEDIEFFLTPEIFTPSELFYLNTLKTQARRRAFYYLWVCKEAYLKALGIGLSKDLNRVEIDPFEPSTRQVVRDLQQTVPPYYLFHLKAIPSSYISVLAVSNPFIQITYCNI